MITISRTFAILINNSSSGAPDRGEEEEKDHDLSTDSGSADINIKKLEAQVSLYRSPDLSLNRPF